MRHLWRPVAIIVTVVLGGALVTASYLSRSGASEGRPNGMTYAAVAADINSEERNIIDASRVFSLPPRMLGAAIAAERAMNFQPYLEDIGDAIFGTSVGFSQVSTVAFRKMLDTLFLPDSLTPFRTGAFNADEARRTFRSSLAAKRYERKLHLLLDTKFNITAAAMILRYSLDRYDAAATQFDVFRRPDLAATLYHRTFPREIRGIPDEFGLMAVRFFNDPTFMPHAMLPKEPDHERRE